LDLGRIEFDGDVLQPPGSSSGKYLSAKFFLQDELHRTVLELAEHAAALIVLREVFLHSYPTLWHGSTLLISEIIIALGSAHVPSSDNAHEPFIPFLKYDNEQPAGTSSTKGNVMAAPRLSKQRRDSKNFFRFFGFDSVTQCEVKNISIIPLEPRDQHRAFSNGNTLHYHQSPVNISPIE
jgi:hypothetical protein